MTLTAVSYERFVAVRLRVRYNNLFSYSRVLKYMLGIWVLNVSLDALQWAKINHVARGTHHVVWLICLLVTGITQVAVLIIVRRSRQQVHGETETIQNVRKQREVLKTCTEHLTYSGGLHNTELSSNVCVILPSDAGI